MSDAQILIEPPAEEIEPPAEEWEAAPMRERIFREVISVHEAEQHFNAERSKAGWWVGGIGAGIGALGQITALLVWLYHAPVVRYTEIDDASGLIHESYAAKDAPDHFNDRVTEHYLKEYVTLRERFVWQLDDETDHRVKLMSSPDEQRRYDEEKAKDNPMRKYGLSGYARAVRFTEGGMKLRGKGKDKVVEYDVQFIKAEVLSANPQVVVESRKTARIVLAFHPEIPMSTADRLDNESGMYTISYNATTD